jgi:hypothetical protein
LPATPSQVSAQANCCSHLQYLLLPDQIAVEPTSRIPVVLMHLPELVLSAAGALICRVRAKFG